MTEKLYFDYPYYFAMFPKRMKIISLVFLLSHRRTRERLGERSTTVRASTASLFLPNVHSGF